MNRSRWNLAIIATVMVLLVLVVLPNAARADYGDITLVSWFPLPDMCAVSDVWGQKIGSNYYALVGETGNRLHIVDVTDPANPAYVGAVCDFPTFDIKSYGGYAYGTDEDVSLPDGTKILDLNAAIANPNSPIISSTTFFEGHNIAISPDGSLMVLERLHARNFAAPPENDIGAMEIFDLTDPFHPTTVFEQLCERPGRYVWGGDLDCVFDPVTERNPAGHDAIIRTTAEGTFLYDFSGHDGVEIWDLDIPFAQWDERVPHGVVEHGWFRDNLWYFGNYAHSGDVTDDGRYLYICDENAHHDPPGRTGDIYIWDLHAPGLDHLEFPVFVDSIADSDASAHNLQIVGDLGFLSYYSDGFKVIDVSDPTSPGALVPLDEYDTQPGIAALGFGGAWGVYAYEDRGYVYVSDRFNGLFVFHVEGFTSGPAGTAPTSTHSEISGTVRHEDGSPGIGVRVTFSGNEHPCPGNSNSCFTRNKTSDESGYFKQVVLHSWDGTATADAIGTFDSNGQPSKSFTDVTTIVSNEDFTVVDFLDDTPSEMNASGMAEALTLNDYDEDGDLDILFIRDAPVASTELWAWNDASGVFELAETFAGDHTSAAWADYDNDGDLDLYIGSLNANELHEQQADGSFSSITGSPINDTSQTYAVSWVDYNLDGRVDMYVGNVGQNHLYKNTASGFVDKTSVSGLGDTGNTRSVAWGDFNLDNKLDVYVANWTEADVLYENDGDGTFSVATPSGLSTSQLSSISAQWGDYDNNGTQDLLVGYWAEAESDLIFKNNGNDTFTQLTMPAEALGPRSSVSWVDFDYDGDLDWVATKWALNNGANEANRYFRNTGSGQFSYVAVEELEFTGEDTRAVLFGDLDTDGRVDAVVANAGFCCGSYEPIVAADHVVTNTTNSRNWIGIRLVGDAANEAAIGAKVSVTGGVNGTQIKYVDGGGNNGSQGPLTLMFGVDFATTVSSVRVDWPSCRSNTLTNLTVNEVHVITEPYTTTGCGGGGGGGGCKQCPQGVSENPGITKFGPAVPNPFNPDTQLWFFVSEPGEVRISIYDVSGRRIRGESLSRRNEGWHNWGWDGRDHRGSAVSTGVYFAVLEAGGTVDTRKIVLVK